MAINTAAVHAATVSLVGFGAITPTAASNRLANAISAIRVMG